MAVNFGNKKFSSSPVPKGLVGKPPQALAEPEIEVAAPQTQVQVSPPSEAIKQVAEAAQELAKAAHKAATATEVVVTAALHNELSIKIDQLVDLKEKTDAVAPMIKKFGALKKELQLIADEQGDPAQPVTLESESGSKVQYSAKKDSNEVDPKAKNDIIGMLKKLVKDGTMEYDDLMSLISFSQSDVEKYLGADVVAKYYKKVPNSGPRTLTAVVKG